MNLFSGLEKFGLNTEIDADIFTDKDSESDNKTQKQVSVNVTNTVKKVDEKEYLLEKSCVCTVCNKQFKSLTIRNTKLRRLQPDMDLRPRFGNVDTLKYDVISCPYCGYTSLSRYFEGLTKGQIQLVKTNVCSSFKPQPPELPETYDYPTAILRTKMALYNSVIKRGKISERAYACLKISWMLRDYVEELKQSTDKNPDIIMELEEERDIFYKEAFEGFQKAVSNEPLPICGMDGNTLDYLLSYMAAYFKDYAFASRLLGKLLTSKTADRRIKDRALELKDIIVAELKKTK